jgi:hypothetical protein
MRSWGPADGPVGPLPGALAELSAAGFSGVLNVIGAPGGTIHLAGGGITAIDTPWSPSAEVILLRSGRVPAADWEMAFTAAAVARAHVRTELVSRGLVGAGEIEALLRTTLADGMFAFATGFVDSCRTEASTLDHALPLEPAADAGWLMPEALRRMHVLAAFPGPRLRPRERVMAVPGAVRPGATLGGGRDEILAVADGRRTNRDLAFVLGSGLYATMLRLARMRAEGLITSLPSSMSPVSSDEGQAPAASRSATAAGLPRRRNDRPVQPPRAGDLPSRPLPSVPGMLHPRSEGQPKPRDMR